MHHRLCSLQPSPALFEALRQKDEEMQQNVCVCRRAYLGLCVSYGRPTIVSSIGWF